MSPYNFMRTYEFTKFSKFNNDNNKYVFKVENFLILYVINKFKVHKRMYVFHFKLTYSLNSL